MMKNFIIYTPHIGAEVARSAQCLTTDWTNGVRSPAGAKDFSSSLCVKTSSEAHPPSYPMGTRGPFLRGKTRPGRDSDLSPPSSAEVKNELEQFLLSALASALRSGTALLIPIICLGC
jgi:hypothetical protein